MTAVSKVLKIQSVDGYSDFDQLLLWPNMENLYIEVQIENDPIFYVCGWWSREDIENTINSEINRYEGRQSIIQQQLDMLGEI